MKRGNFPPLKFTPNKYFGESSQSDWYRYIKDEKDPGGFEVKFINADIGKGVFATELKRSGSFLLEYHGALITREEGLRREKSYPLRLGSFLFFFKVGRKEQCVDATFSKSFGRFVNDGIGQDRNAEARVVFLKKVPHIAIFAVKNIQPGQEIRYDYGVQDLPWRKTESRKGSTPTNPGLILCDIVKHSNCITHMRDGVQRQKQRKSAKARDTNIFVGQSTEREEKLHISKYRKTDGMNPAPTQVEINCKEFAISKHGNYDPIYANSESSIVDVENTGIDTVSIDILSTSGDENLNICQFQKTDGTNAAPTQVEINCKEFAISKHENYDTIDANSESSVVDVENTVIDMISIDVVSTSGDENLNICQFQKTDGTNAAPTQVEINCKEFAISKHENYDTIDANRESSVVDVENTDIDTVSIDVASTSGDENLNICQFQKTAGTNAAPSEVEINCEESAISKHGNYDTIDANSESSVVDVENTGIDMVSIDVASISGDENLNICQFQKTDGTNAAPSQVEINCKESAISKHENYDTIDANSEPSIVAVENTGIDMVSIDIVSTSGDENLNICQFQKTAGANAAPSEVEINCEESAISKHGNYDTMDANSENQFAEEDNLSLVRETQPEDDGTIVFRVCRSRKNTDADRSVSVNETARDFNPRSTLQQDRRKGGKPHRPCPFCLEYKSKLKNHLKSEHKNQKEVKDAMSLPPNERTHAFAKLRKLGIYKENVRLIREKGAAGYADLIRERRQGEDSPIMCVGCKAFVSRKQFYRHRKLCNSASFSSPPRSLDPRFLANMKKNEFYATYQCEVLGRFRCDDVGELCKEDPYITAYGYHKYLAIGKRKRKKDEKRKSLMNVMRRISRLYLDFKAIKKDGTTVSADMFLRENKDFFKETIFSRKSNSNADSNLIDGFTIKKFAHFLHDMFADNGDDDRVDQTSKFLRTLSYNWTELFGESECEVLINRSHNRKPTQLPAEEDIKKLRIYILRSLTKMTSDTYGFIAEAEFTFLRDLLVSRLTLFNARRGGEPSRLTLDEWQDAKNDVWLNKLTHETNDLEDLQLLQEFKVSYQAGKDDGKLVPVIFPGDCIEGIKLLTDKSVRKDAGVHPSNEYLFPRIHLSEFHVIGTTSIDSICRRAGVKPITATKMRHRAATIYADQDVDQRERQAFFTHMGHADTINRHVYQCPPAFLEVTKVGKFLRHLDKVSEPGETSSESTPGETSSQSTSGCSRVPASVTVSEPGETSSQSTPGETSSQSTSGCSRVPASVTALRIEACNSQHRQEKSAFTSQHRQEKSACTSQHRQEKSACISHRQEKSACTSQHRQEKSACTSQHRQQSACFAESVPSACITPAEASSQDEENETECNEGHLLTARKDSSPRATKGDEPVISSTQDVLHERQYVRWSKEDTAKVNSYFFKYVYDVSRFDKRGILPGYTEIRRFLKRYPDLLPQLPLDLKLKTIHTKLFNERNKSRRIAEKKIPQSS